MPKIRVYKWNQSFLQEIECKDKEKLSQVLINHDMKLDTACGQKGTCNKCKVLIASRQEVEKKWELSCQYRVDQDIDVFLPDINEEKMQILDVEKFVLDNQRRKSDRLFKESAVHVAVDVGTTTLAFALIADTTKQVLATSSEKNPQRIYGLDVISRMQSSIAGKKEELKSCIWKCILDKIDEMLITIQKEELYVDKIVISANTAMQHMLMGYDCKTLSVAPFIPHKLVYDKVLLGEVAANLSLNKKDIELILLPGASAFVGGDIISGVYALDLDFESQEECLFLDLGTNGEMVYKKDGKFFATATAAGPALEAANISCGVAGIEGAISKVNIIANKIQIKTLGNKNPIGICGSGVIEAVYEFLKAGWMDESGRIIKQDEINRQEITLWEQLGNDVQGKGITFTQEDIRQVQMAKAAIRSGMETLIREAKAEIVDVKNVYLAGGLGYSLNTFKAAGIGLIIPSFRMKTKAVGNTSLLGAIKYLQEEDGKQRLHALAQKIKAFNLAQNKEFEETYINNINF